MSSAFNLLLVVLLFSKTRYEENKLDAVVVDNHKAAIEFSARSCRESSMG